MLTDCREWLAEDGFLSFYHKDHPKHGKEFSDTVDSTAIWLLQATLNASIGKREIREILGRGIESRWDGLSFVRHPGADTPMKRDQLDYFVPLLRMHNKGKLADILVEEYGGYLLPHHRDHLYARNTWLGRRADELDAWVDGIGEGSMPSLMNNIARYVVHSARGCRRRRAVSLFKERWDPWFVMVVYGARRPETEAGKKGEELVQVRWKVYQDAMTYGASISTPPPIYLGYDKIFRRYL